MKRSLRFGLVVSLILAVTCPVLAQVSPARLKVTRSSKSDTKQAYQTSDGWYRSSEKVKSVLYKIDVSNVSGGPAKEFLIKWAVVIKSDSNMYVYKDGDYTKASPLRVIQGEKTCKLDFGKSCNFETDVIDLAGWESVDGGHRREEYGAKILGYSVEVFCNDQRVAAENQPADIKAKIDQASGDNKDGQKRHQF
jgi:hypothetical protein